MNEQQYRQLCQACDAVLLAPGAPVERVAISWLHVVREHPVFLAGYSDLFESPSWRTSLARVQRFVRNRLTWLRQLGRAARASGKPWHASVDELPVDIHVLFVSHLLNASQAGQANDFYFGSVPNELAAQGYRVVIALLDHSGLAPETAARKWQGAAVPRAVFSKSLTVSRERASKRRLVQESRRLRRWAKTATSALQRAVARRAAEEAMSSNSRLTARLASQIGEIVAATRPRAIVVTHEGHAWERVAFSAARAAHADVKCIGYLHAALFRMQHAVRRHLGAQYNPDAILTSGLVGMQQLEQVAGLSGTPLAVFGSNRSIRAGSSSADTAAPGTARRPLTCLVIPEGIPEECHGLFGFSLACAQACPDVRFIWRLHPIVSFELLAKQNERLRSLPANVALSRVGLEEDLKASDWALYRGTTAVVQAVAMGVKPVYLQRSGEMSIDPLYELDESVSRIASVEDFRRLVAEQEAAGAERLVRAREAKIYCENFYVPFDREALLRAVP